jgi:hypothetical protein
LQEPFAASLDKVSASHNLISKAFRRLGGACGKHYIPRLDRSLASGLNISDKREPTRCRAPRRNCAGFLENTAVRRGRNHCIHRFPDQSQKLPSAGQGHGAISRFQELLRKRMAS